MDRKSERDVSRRRKDRGCGQRTGEGRGVRQRGSSIVRRVEGGEGPAREFPAFAQPHIDPTPVTPRILLLRLGVDEEGWWGQTGGQEVGGLSAYTQYEGEDGEENQRNRGLRVVQRGKSCAAVQRRIAFRNVRPQGSFTGSRTVCHRWCRERRQDRSRSVDRCIISNVLVRFQFLESPWC